MEDDTKMSDAVAQVPSPQDSGDDVSDAIQTCVEDSPPFLELPPDLAEYFAYLEKRGPWRTSIVEPQEDVEEFDLVEAAVSSPVSVGCFELHRYGNSPKLSTSICWQAAVLRCRELKLLHKWAVVEDFGPPDEFTRIELQLRVLFHWEAYVYSEQRVNYGLKLLPRLEAAAEKTNASEELHLHAETLLREATARAQIFRDVMRRESPSTVFVFNDVTKISFVSARTATPRESDLSVAMTRYKASIAHYALTGSSDR